VRWAFEIIELIGFNRPEKKRSHHSSQYQYDGQKQINDIHVANSGDDGVCW
jgi:hypothetical protein